MSAAPCLKLFTSEKSNKQENIYQIKQRNNEKKKRRLENGCLLEDRIHPLQHSYER
jgi:hypothetical protein